MTQTKRFPVFCGKRRVIVFREIDTRAPREYLHQMVWLRTLPFSSAMDTPKKIRVKRSRGFSEATKPRCPNETETIYDCALGASALAAAIHDA
jgi:hypothetical protein